MKTINLIVEEEFAGQRIDVFLSDKLEELSRSRIQNLLKNGDISSSLKAKIKKNHLVSTAEELTVLMPESEELDVIAENIALDIVYQDKDVAVVNKPAGMVVHPAAGNHSGTLVNALLFHLDDLSSIGGVIRPGIVHRIDKDTSGLLMIAKNDMAHQSLSQQLKDHSVKREYIAIVRGGFKTAEGFIDQALARSKNNRLKMAVTSSGKRAITHYKLLEQFGEQSVISCRLETGRTHQIRVHMAYIGHPLVGDTLYGIKKDRQNGDGQMLHAKTLGFVHPRSGEQMEFSSELPIKMTRYIENLRRKYAT